MSKKILLIENDSAFAEEVSHALEAAGFEARVTGDGKEGLDLARDFAPDAIVLCVELPGMSGYLICQKLKKDEALKVLPLVLTSAEATEETFEKHKTLKARADEYLLKPYEPAALVEKLGALVGLPEGAGGDQEREEEVVSLEEETGLEATAEGEPGQDIPGLDLQSLPDEPAAAGTIDADELKLLDEAFDGISAPAAPGEAAAALDLELAGEKPVRLDDVDAAAESLPEEDEGADSADLGSLDEDAERALGALGGADESLAPEEDEPEPTTRPVRGASADILRAAGIKVLDGDDTSPGIPDEPEPERDAPEPLGGSSREDDRDLADLRADLAARDAELKDAKRRNAELARRAEAAEERVRKAEGDLDASRDEVRAAEARLADAERRATDAEDDARRRSVEAETAGEATAKADALEREMDELRTEILVARGEAEGARGEVEKRTQELRKRVSDLEAANVKNEERVVKAYQKIKTDEKVREKVRKALAIATQLIDEGAPAEPSAKKERRPAPAIGRE